MHLINLKAAVLIGSFYKFDMLSKSLYNYLHDLLKRRNSFVHSKSTKFDEELVEIFCSIPKKEIEACAPKIQKL